MLPEDLKVEIARGLRRPRDAAGKIIPGPGEPLEDFIRRIVELAYQRGREDERKECAKVCEEDEYDADSPYGASRSADAIRRRGKP